MSSAAKRAGNLAILSALAFGIAVRVSAGRQPADAIAWGSDFQLALAQARKNHQIVMADFYLLG